jgi:hypothetical protein
MVSLHPYLVRTNPKLSKMKMKALRELPPKITHNDARFILNYKEIITTIMMKFGRSNFPNQIQEYLKYAL